MSESATEVLLPGATALSGVHVVVLVHGLLGFPSDFSVFIEKLCAEPHLSEVVLHASSCNGGTRTFQGLETTGGRLVLEVEDVFARHGSARVSKLSFICHSLGGLIARYAVGKMLERGDLEGVELMNFVTVATPHVGTRRSPTTFTNQAINRLTRTLISKTGVELMLEDRGQGQPLLLQMSQPGSSFVTALSRFRTRVLYGNVRHDLTVPFPTSCIVGRNPFARMRRGDLKFLPEFPHLVEISEHVLYSPTKAQAQQQESSSHARMAPQGTEGKSALALARRLHFWEHLRAVRAHHSLVASARARSIAQEQHTHTHTHTYTYRNAGPASETSHEHSGTVTPSAPPADPLPSPGDASSSSASNNPGSISSSGEYSEHASALSPTSATTGMYEELFQHDAKAAQLRETLRNLQAILKPYSAASNDEVPRHIARNFML